MVDDKNKTIVRSIDLRIIKLIDLELLDTNKIFSCYYLSSELLLLKLFSFGTQALYLYYPSSELLLLKFFSLSIRTLSFYYFRAIINKNTIYFQKTA